MLAKTIEDGSAIEQMKRFVEAQGGDPSYVDDTSKFPVASIVRDVVLEKSGYVERIETEEIGLAAMMLGGGRETKDSVIDLSVGFIVHKKVGDKVGEKEPIATVYGNDAQKVDAAVRRFKEAYFLSATECNKVRFIKDIVS